MNMIDKLVNDEIAEAGNLLQDACYGASVRRGWWSDPATGDKFDPKVKFCEKLALIHSEVSECLEGFRKGLMDDKLPHREMAEVELADAVIRIMDLSGALGYSIGDAIAEKMQFNSVREDHSKEHRLAGGGKKF